MFYDPEGDYKNSWTEWAKENRNPFGDVYVDNPDKVWNWGDFGWWVNNTTGLIESIAQFGTTGFGIGGGINCTRD